MKKWSLVALLTVLFACGSNSGKQEESANIMAGMLGDTVFTPEIQTYIQTLSDLDCKMYTLIVESTTVDDAVDGREEFNKLRQQKKEIIEKIRAINADSTFMNAVRLSLHNLNIDDQHCRQAESSVVADQSVSATLESLNIREDAGKLAELNCKIMDAHKRVDANPGKSEMDAALRALVREKRSMLQKLMKLYGNEIMHDAFFQKMVWESQNKTCNFTNELKDDGRFNQFAP